MAALSQEVLGNNYERMPADEVGFVFIGPSGAGKSTLRDYVCAQGDGTYEYVKYLPLTSRQKRPGEDEEYHFVTPVEMMAAKNSTNAIFGNQSYGNEFLTLWPERLPDNSRYIYIYLPEAAVKLKETFPETRIVQIRPTSLDVLRDRISARDPNLAHDELMRRLDAAEQELSYGAEIADAIIVNDASIEEVSERILIKMQELTENRDRL